MWFAFFCAGVSRGGLLLVVVLLPLPFEGGEGRDWLCDRGRLFGCALPASGVGAGLLRVEDPPVVVAVVVVVFFVVVPLVDGFVTAFNEDVEGDLSEVEGSPWPIRLGSICVVDELSYGRQARAVATAG